MSNRYSHIDILKGLGILFVFLGHAVIPDEYRKYIYSFHMPLFFFLGGYLFTKKEIPFRSFFLKKLKTIYIPYLIFSIYSLYLLNPLFDFRAVYEAIPYILLGGKYILNSWFYPGLANNPLWFLPCFFAVNIIFFLIRKLPVSRSIFIMIVLTLSACGYGLGKTNISMLPFSIDTALTSLLYFFIGFECRRFSFSLNRFSPWIILITAILNFQIAMNFDRIMMISNDYPPFYIWATVPLLGITTYFIAAKLIKQNLILEYIGKNSLIFFGFNYPLIIKLNDLGKLLQQNMFGSLLFCFIQIVTIIPIVFVLTKLFPFVLGKPTNTE